MPTWPGDALEYLVGFYLSTVVCWRKIRAPKAEGRVQSVAYGVYATRIEIANSSPANDMVDGGDARDPRGEHIRRRLVGGRRAKRSNGSTSVQAGSRRPSRTRSTNATFDGRRKSQQKRKAQSAAAVYHFDHSTQGQAARWSALPIRCAHRTSGGLGGRRTEAKHAAALSPIGNRRRANSEKRSRP